MDTLKTILKDNIRYYRNLKGFTQEQLAEYCKLSTSYIAAIETGMKVPSLKSLHRIGGQLGIEVAQLLTARDELEVQAFVRRFATGMGGVEAKIDQILSILEADK